MEECSHITKEEFNSVIKVIRSYYQGKKAMLKKQAAHWHGKFAICKAENNKLRQRIKELENNDQG
jgi:hypothetical protein